MFSCFFVVVVGDIMKLTMLNTRFMKIHFRPLLCHSIVEHISHNIRFHVRLCQLSYLESGSTCSTLYARSPFCVQRRHGEREAMKQLSNCLTCRDGPCSPVPLAQSPPSLQTNSSSLSLQYFINNLYFYSSSTHIYSGRCSLTQSSRSCCRRTDRHIRLLTNGMTNRIFYHQINQLLLSRAYQSYRSHLILLSIRHWSQLLAIMMAPRTPFDGNSTLR